MTSDDALKLSDVATAIGVEFSGDGSLPITGVGSLTSAGPGDISFFSMSRFRDELIATQAAAVIVDPQVNVEFSAARLFSSNPQLSFAQVANILCPPPPVIGGVHPSAWVAADAQVDPSAAIAANCVVEAGAHIAARVSIGPNSTIGARAVVGADSRIAANVTIAHGVMIGERATIQSGAVIGGDGFGLAFAGDRWEAVPQLGGVTIGNDVDVGANTTIDRGALDDTIIEDGVKLDNQVQIAHNVRIGAHTAIAGCVGIAGSSQIGRYCMIGGGVGISGHLHITDKVTITGMSLVAQSINEPGLYSSGLTVEKNRLWNRISARMRRIEQLAKRLTTLEKRLGAEPQAGNSATDSTR